MKYAILVAVFIAVVARADNLYIVPVAGTVTGAHGEYSTVIRALNPNATDASLIVDGAFPLFGDANTSCTGQSLTIPPTTIRDGVTIAGECCAELSVCTGRLGAVALRSTAALELRSDVFLFSGNTYSWQPMEIGRAWIPGSREALIDRAIAFDSSSLTNLFLVNPNPFPIHVTYRVDFSNTADVIVPARRTLYVPLSYNFANCPISCGSDGLFLRSDFDYFAAAISFSDLLPRVVRIAVPLSP
jgi:hypothetical protein